MRSALVVLVSLVSFTSCAPPPTRDVTGSMQGRFTLTGDMLTLSEKYRLEGDLTSRWTITDREDGRIEVYGVAGLTGYLGNPRRATLVGQGGTPVFAKLGFVLDLDEQGNMGIIPGPPEGTFFVPGHCALVFEAVQVAGKLDGNDFKLWGTARFDPGCDIQESSLTFSLSGTRGER